MDGRPFAFAGLGDCWRPADAEPVYSYTMLTCEPCDFMHTIHSRMPVLLEERAWERWLDSATPPADAKALLVPYTGELAAEAESARPAGGTGRNGRRSSPPHRSGEPAPGSAPRCAGPPWASSARRCSPPLRRWSCTPAVCPSGSNSGGSAAPGKRCAPTPTPSGTRGRISETPAASRWCAAGAGMGSLSQPQP